MFLGSQLRKFIDAAIVHLQQSGKLRSLKKRWWHDKQNGNRCSDQDPGQQKAESLDIDHLGGVFIILGLGMTSSFVIACAERVLRSRKGNTVQHFK